MYWVSASQVLHGFEDILIESEVVAPGSMKSVSAGSMVNRSVRAHKLLYEALIRLQIQEFLQETQQSNELESTILQTREQFSQNNSFDVAICADFAKQFNLYVAEKCAKSATYSLWNSYLEMVSLLLSFIRATRTSNWNLHLASLRQMLPYFFAYDRNNYAR